jgi:hypothetical protein
LRVIAFGADLQALRHKSFGPFIAPIAFFGEQNEKIRKTRKHIGATLNLSLVAQMIIAK